VSRHSWTMSLAAVVALLVLAQPGLVAQAGGASATDITKANIDAVLGHQGPDGVGTDRQIKVVDLGKYNLGVGVLRRGPTKEGAPVGAIAHSQVTEVYYIISGGGTLVTGGTIVGQKPLAAESEVVRIAVGASVSGTFQGGERRLVGPGDVVIIPAGVPHGFADIKDHVTYLSVRPDPDHVLPAGYVHPALKQ